MIVFEVSTVYMKTSVLPTVVVPFSFKRGTGSCVSVETQNVPQLDNSEQNESVYLCYKQLRETAQS